MVLAHNIEDVERTKDVFITQSITFESMLLAANTLEGLRNSGFFKPSPIQLHGIPLGKCGFDLLLEAKSGTGKTAVFSVIALENIDFRKGLQAIMLAPTREIAAQICDVTKQIGSSYNDLKVEVVMGGLPVQEDIFKFKNRNVHIVVGSPGRLRHLIQEKYINVSAVRLLVLDEADKLMEKSFLPDINYIFSVLPKQKQVIMSSATYSESTHSFIENYVQTAQHVCPDSNNILLGVKQKVTTVQSNSNIVRQTKHRFEELLKILTRHTFKQCLIFCNYQARIAELHKMLKKEKWPAQQLYGQQEQLDRLDALKSLQEYKCRILISTDLAARGIDASNVDLVINFEPPLEWQTYLHRIGRAGRYGSHGMAVTILSEGKEKKKFTNMLETIKGPLNLSSLWTDEQLIDNKYATNHSSETSELQHSIKNHTTKSKHEQLWSLLICSKKHDNEIETFESLYDCFNKPEIESFTDLLKSIENHQHISNISNEKVNSYQLLALQSVPVIRTQGSKNKLTHESHNEHKSTQFQDLKNEKTGSKYKNQKANGSEYISKDATSSKNIVSKTPIICSKGSGENPLNSNETVLEAEYEIPNIEDALLNAGLPLAFSSSKDKTIKPKINSLTKNENEKWLENVKIKKSYQKPLNQQTKLKSSNQSNRNDSPKTNVRSNKSLKSSKASNHSKFRQIENEQSFTNTSYNFQYECRKQKLTNKIKRDYLTWYSQLKFQVKQVEHAIYIDEMSKC